MEGGKCYDCPFPSVYLCTVGDWGKVGSKGIGWTKCPQIPLPPPFHLGDTTGIQYYNYNYSMHKSKKNIQLEIENEPMYGKHLLYYRAKHVEK